MASVEIRPSIKSDVKVVADNIREADRKEIDLSLGMSPEKALLDGFMGSDQCYTAEVDGVPAIMYGIRSHGLILSTATIWMLSTPDLYKIKKQFIQQCKDEVAKMCEGYSEVSNYVDVNNKASIRWLKWLGFEFEAPKPFGKAQHPFMRFSK